MLSNSKFAKFLLFGLIVALIVWLGGSIYRSIIAYRLFEPLSLIIRSELTYEAISQTLLIIASVNLYVILSYIIFLILYFTLIFKLHINLKNEGWLLMITIIIILFLPIEVFVLKLDLQLLLLVYSNNFDLNQGISLLVQRFGALGGLPAIAFMCYLTAIWLSIFRPLRKLV